MAEYRIYPLDKEGRFICGLDVTCDSDTEVRELAQQFLFDGQQAEVWIGARLVGRVSAASAEAIPLYGRGWLVDEGLSFGN